MILFFTKSLPFFDISLFQMFYFFCFWSVFGWFLEVIVRSIETGGFENRGFLNGAFCPIYGFGVLGVTTLLRSFVEKEALMFILSALICTVLEWLVGRLLLSVFHTRWWDYSNYKFHSPDGLISLESTLFWGIACVSLLKVLQPMVSKAVSYIPIKFGIVMIFVILTIIIIDIIVTVNEVRKLSYNLGKLQTIGDILDVSSQSVGKKIANNTLNLKSKYDEQVVQYNLLVKEIKSSRLAKAFPNMEYQKNKKIKPSLLKELPTMVSNAVKDKLQETTETVIDKIYISKEKRHERQEKKHSHDE